MFPNSNSCGFDSEAATLVSVLSEFYQILTDSQADRISAKLINNDIQVIFRLINYFEKVLPAHNFANLASELGECCLNLSTKTIIGNSELLEPRDYLLYAAKKSCNLRDEILIYCGIRSNETKSDSINLNLRIEQEWKEAETFIENLKNNRINKLFFKALDYEKIANDQMKESNTEDAIKNLDKAIKGYKTVMKSIKSLNAAKDFTKKTMAEVAFYIAECYRKIESIEKKPSLRHHDNEFISYYQKALELDAKIVELLSKHKQEPLKMNTKKTKTIDKLQNDKKLIIEHAEKLDSSQISTSYAACTTQSVAILSSDIAVIQSGDLNKSKVLEEENANLKQEVLKLQIELNKYKISGEKQNAEIKNAQQELDNAQKNIKELNSKFEVFTKEIDALRQQISTLNGEKELANKSSVGLSVYNNLQKVCNELKDKTLRFESELTNKDNINQVLQHSLQISEDSYGTALHDIDVLNDQVKELKHTITKLEDELKQERQVKIIDRRLSDTFQFWYKKYHAVPEASTSSAPKPQSND